MKKNKKKKTYSNFLRFYIVEEKTNSSLLCNMQNKASIKIEKKKEGGTARNRFSALMVS